MMLGNDGWFDRMPWVPPMPGNKNYVLQEAQKEIERLRQEIGRSKLENEELRAEKRTGSEQACAAEKKKQSEGAHEGAGGELRKGGYLYTAGVVKVLDRAQPLSNRL